MSGLSGSTTSPLTVDGTKICESAPKHKQPLLAKVLRIPHFIVSGVVAVTWLGFPAKHLTGSNDAHCETDKEHNLSMCKCNIAGGHKIRAAAANWGIIQQQFDQPLAEWSPHVRKSHLGLSTAKLRFAKIRGADAGRRQRLMITAVS